jgi:hypothetical protein
MPSQTSGFEQELTALEAELKRLEAEYNMFFAGRLPRLPWETRARVDALIKQYDRMHLANTAHRFRFNTIQARYAAFCDLWERTLKAKEEGRRPRGRVTMPAAPPARHAAAHDPAAARVVAVAALRDPSTETERVRELYERLTAARQAAGEPPVPYERFSQVIRAQMAKHGAGGREVSFRVAVRNGKVTLSVGPVQSGE